MYAIVIPTRCEKSAIHWWVKGGYVVCEKPPYHFSFHGENQWLA